MIEEEGNTGVDGSTRSAEVLVGSDHSATEALIRRECYSGGHGRRARGSYFDGLTGYDGKNIRFQEL